MTHAQLNQQVQQLTAALAECRQLLVDHDTVLAEYKKALDERDAAISEYKKALAERDAVNAELSETLRKLQDQLAWCKRQLFSPKSERYQDPGQDGLFADQAETTGESGPPVESVAVPAHERRATGRGKREPLPDHFRREEIRHELPEEQRIDPETGQALLKAIGEEVSEKLAYKPGEIYVERHVRIKYRKVDHENLSGDEPEIVIAPACGEGLAKCLAAPSLLAEVVVRKYGDHTPLDRLEKIFKRHGVDLSKASMCRWVQGVGELLQPLVERMKQQMIAHSRVIQHDDTPVRQQEPGRGATRTCRFWTAVGEPGTAGHYVVYLYTQDRGRAGPEAWFRDGDGRALFVGKHLQCDQYAGYLAEGGLLDPNGPWRMVHLGCWAHVRRKFHDARTGAPGPACHALGLIRQLYAVEAEYNNAEPAQRYEARQKHSKPVVDRFFDWCRGQSDQHLPKSQVAEGMGYALNQEAALRRYLEAGHLQIDNNACERSLRGIAIGRKNWLFTGSPAGGEAAARLFSLIASAQLHGIEPLAYLHDVIRRLPTTPPSQLDDFLPDRWSNPAAGSS